MLKDLVSFKFSELVNTEENCPKSLIIIHYTCHVCLFITTGNSNPLLFLRRILADDSVVEIVRNYFIIPEEIEAVEGLGRIFVDNKPDWVCWQTGLELRYMETTLFSLKQVLHKVVTRTFDYYAMPFALVVGRTLLRQKY